MRGQDERACIAAIVQAIGQRFRHEYDALAQPMPERLTIRLGQLAQREESASPGGPNPEGLRPPPSRRRPSRRNVPLGATTPSPIDRLTVDDAVATAA